MEMKMKVKMTAGDVFKIAEWLESKGLYDKRDAEVCIETDSNSGIGLSLEVRATTGDREGVWIDMTDYDSW